MNITRGETCTHVDVRDPRMTIAASTADLKGGTTIASRGHLVRSADLSYVVLTFRT
jgi:hypothetical protein